MATQPDSSHVSLNSPMERERWSDLHLSENATIQQPNAREHTIGSSGIPNIGVEKLALYEIKNMSRKSNSANDIDVCPRKKATIQQPTSRAKSICSSGCLDFGVERLTLHDITNLSKKSNCGHHSDQCPRKNALFQQPTSRGKSICSSGLPKVGVERLTLHEIYNLTRKSKCANHSDQCLRNNALIQQPTSRGKSICFNDNDKCARKNTTF
ncbi:hypothetical protein RIF29_14934 [Crotalaria pallida]|uniref:Uncharacterized protein n=1 Tax=Crotalaria pallida TaxID=3830 RepID=A0AAN9FI28_CROPI